MNQRRPKPTDQPAEHGRKDTGARVVETRKSQVWQGVTYQLAYNVSDGKQRGPYWRAYFWDSTAGKTRSKYIGKEFRELEEDEFG